MIKKLKLIFTIVLTTIFLTACEGAEQTIIRENLLGIDFSNNSNITTLDKYNVENPVVALYIKNYGSVVIELYPDMAPNTVNNFISLVKNGFYDNNTLHRLVDDFVLQGGDPTGTGMGGPDYSIKGEFEANGINNSLRHEKGIISMARSQSYDSAGSQFFIVLGNASHLDGYYAAFGKVIDGWSNIENIVSNEEIIDLESGKLKNNLTLKKAVVDLKNYQLKELEKINTDQ